MLSPVTLSTMTLAALIGPNVPNNLLKSSGYIMRNTSKDGGQEKKERLKGTYLDQERREEGGCKDW